MLAVRPSVDAELAPVLGRFLERVPRMSAETLSSIRQARHDISLAGVKIDLTVGGAVEVEERTAPGPDGAHITLLVLSPASRDERLPVIYHVHGGGMVAGTRHFGVEAFTPFVADGRAVVVSVEYRLAPEHPDPAPVEDCYTGLVWTIDHADEMGIDPGRAVIVGHSAGGGLAAGTALLARDRGFPIITHQVLLCPMLDDRFETPSSTMLDGDGTWDRHENLFGWRSLLGDRCGGDDVSPYAAPARADDLDGLPPAYIDVGSVDGFRDEAIAYAQRLSSAGVSVDLHVWAGGFHGFEAIAPDSMLARSTTAARNEFIERALSRPPGVVR